MVTKPAERTHMLNHVRKDFPELFTVNGRFKKRKPAKYKCVCGNTFSTEKTSYHNLGGLGVGFSVGICKECGAQCKRNPSHVMWERLTYSQIEMEEFILEIVTVEPGIRQEIVKQRTEKVFEAKDYNALSYLCYYGYLNVDTSENEAGRPVVKYSVNPDVDTERRYKKRI